jgi:uncharacterized protein YceK
MRRVVILLCVFTLVAGCGLAETGTAAATSSTSAAQQAAQAQQTEARVRQNIDAAYQQAAQQRAAAEADGR